MRLRIGFVAAFALIAGHLSLASGWQSRNGDGACHATSPSHAGGSYGNRLLSVEGLWANGTVIFKPGGPGFVTSDGALGMKFGWTRGVRGKVNVTGHRLDGTAGPLRFEASSGMGDIGFQASYLVFPTPGCWQVTARVGDRYDSEITFVVRVVRIADFSDESELHEGGYDGTR